MKIPRSAKLAQWPYVCRELVSVENVRKSGAIDLLNDAQKAAQIGTFCFNTLVHIMSAAKNQMHELIQSDTRLSPPRRAILLQSTSLVLERMMPNVGDRFAYLLLMERMKPEDLNQDMHCQFNHLIQVRTSMRNSTAENLAGAAVLSARAIEMIAIPSVASLRLMHFALETVHTLRQICHAIEPHG